MATHGPPCIRNQKETGTWKAPNEGKGKSQMRGRESPNWRKEDALSLRRGKQIAEQKRKKSSWKMLKSECPNEGKEKPKLGEGRKAAAQPHPVDLCQVRQWKGASSRVDDSNYVHYSPLSMNIFCHNLPWKENSTLIGPSFSRPSTQEGRGTWLGPTRPLLAAPWKLSARILWPWGPFLFKNGNTYLKMMSQLLFNVL